MHLEVSGHKITFCIDRQIYNDITITKVLYWLTGTYVVERKYDDVSKSELVTLSYKGEDFFDRNKGRELYAKISQDLIDYKLRDIINKETKDIRTILYIKALSHDEELCDEDIE